MNKREGSLLAEVRNDHFEFGEEIVKDKNQPFEPCEITESEKKVEIHWDSIYDKAIAELGLQQTKRDQLITIYIALYAFLIPAILETDKISLRVQGYLFLASSILGFLFGVIIIRYRIYKEAYWLCCQSITALMRYEYGVLNKKFIQTVFYRTMEKKGKKYIGRNRRGKIKFRRWYYVYKNFVSSETLYFLIHTLITSGVFGLSMSFIWDVPEKYKILLAFGTGIALALVLIYWYFYECIKLYKVLVDHKDKSFNHTFKMAWFLHFYV